MTGCFFFHGFFHFLSIFFLLYTPITQVFRNFFHINFQISPRGSFFVIDFLLFFLSLQRFFFVFFFHFVIIVLYDKVTNIIRNCIRVVYKCIIELITCWPGTRPDYGRESVISNRQNVVLSSNVNLSTIRMCLHYSKLSSEWSYLHTKWCFLRCGSFIDVRNPFSGSRQ